MSMKEQILAMLLEQNGEALSGSEMAKRLCVTRAAVWKIIASLRKEGYHITAVTNLGYTLRGADKLTCAGVRARLGTKILGRELTVIETVDSTNTYLKELARQGAPEGLTVIAQEQSAGRGRVGKSFFSPKGTGLYMSVLLRPHLLATDAGELTMLAAVAVARAVARLYDVRPQIKWVNDIYLDGKKLCGILSEASIELESGALEYAVVGIGINFSTPADVFPQNLKKIAVSLSPSADAAGMESLAAEVLAQLEALYLALPGRAFMDEYRRLSFVIGRTVTFTENGEIYRLPVCDIDDDGALILDEGGGKTRRLISGEISIHTDGQ